jgi:hypothetical protein
VVPEVKYRLYLAQTERLTEVFVEDERIRRQSKGSMCLIEFPTGMTFQSLFGCCNNPREKYIGKLHEVFLTCKAEL